MQTGIRERSGSYHFCCKVRPFHTKVNGGTRVIALYPNPDLASPLWGPDTTNCIYRAWDSHKHQFAPCWNSFFFLLYPSVHLSLSFLVFCFIFLYLFVFFLLFCFVFISLVNCGFFRGGYGFWGHCPPSHAYTRPWLYPIGERRWRLRHLAT